MRHRANTVTDISIDDLYHKGIKGILLDLDNTIIAWNEHSISSAIHQWIGQGKEKGIAFCLLSNSYTSRAKRIANELNIHVIAPAFKPLPFGYRRAMRFLATNASNTVMIGDQLFTDMLGARFLKINTIYVTPLSTAEFCLTRISRCLERLVWK